MYRWYCSTIVTAKTIVAVAPCSLYLLLLLWHHRYYIYHYYCGTILGLFLLLLLLLLWAGIAQSVQRLATDWTVWGSYPGGSEIFRTRSDWSCGPPSFLYNGYRICFPGVKRPGRGVGHSRPSSAEVKERVELYLYSPCGPSWPVLRRTLLLLLLLLLL
jgi:hypothetical protein